MSWLRSTVSTPPSIEPVLTADVKMHCRITDTTEDSNIAIYAKAARRTIEARCGAKLISQTVDLLCSQWNDLRSVPIYPLQSITSIKYLDSNGIEQTLDPAVYSVVVGRNPVIYLNQGQQWPALYCPTGYYFPDYRNLTAGHINQNFGSTAPDAIRVQGVFGFGATAADVPEDLKTALFLLAGTWIENRESIGDVRFSAVVSIPDGVEALLADYYMPA